MELAEIKGIGKSRLSQLNQAGIFLCEDLLNLYPKKYYDFSAVCDFAEDNLHKIILVTILDQPKVVRLKNLAITTVSVKDESGNIFTAIWYNQPFIKQALIQFEQYYLYGINSTKKRNTFMVSMMKHSKKVSTNMLAVYKKIGTIGSDTMAGFINKVLSEFNPQSLILNNIERKYGLLDLKRAYCGIHQPIDYNNYLQAKRRLDIEKLIPLAIKNLNQTVYNSAKRTFVYKNIDKIYQDFLKLLNFSLTSDQRSVISDIIGDLSSDFSMNRLLQGEVGSGKTIVSFFCLYLATQNQTQSVLIAPTEILARQHFDNLSKLFSGTNIKIAFLHGGMPAANKREVLRSIKMGQKDIIIGTHSAFSDDVFFKNLSLAIIDEQHKFGVAQRAKLSSKGNNIDVLVMSATPIPRSMALAIYGDLKLSVIYKCPFAKIINTNLVTSKKQTDMWKFISEKTAAGSRVFVVCAHIESSEDDNDSSATNMAKYISNLFGKDNVRLLHGKTNKKEQQKTMQDFANGVFNVLVSTTIVEVGVDVPEADIMVICNPDKFGLATLHQLRGRVGRNGKESYCFCLLSNISESAYERLKFFKDNNNGFDIAEYDYANRGAGDIFGTAQHGISGTYTINLKEYDVAKEIVQDPLFDKSNMLELLEIANKKYSQICEDIILN